MRVYYELNLNGNVTCKRLKTEFFDKVVYPYIFMVDKNDFVNVSNQYKYNEILMFDSENMILWK